MSPQAQTSKKRFIVQPNMCAGGPRQPPSKGRDKPGAVVRPPVLFGTKSAKNVSCTGGLTPARGARFVSTLERRLLWAALTHVKLHYDVFF